MSGEEHEQIKRIPTVGIVVMHPENGRFLLVRHEEGAGHLTGSYGTAGGRVDAGETKEDAAVRELREETGLVARVEDLTPLPRRYLADLPRKDGSILHVDHQVYICQQFTGEPTETEEATPEWIEESQLNDLPLLPNIKDMIEQAKDTIVINK